MAVNKRLLLLNTSVSYMRTLLSIGLSLFSARWLMNSLGVEDYGLYFVVGGLIAFLTFINSALSSGSQRFFSHSMDVGIDVVRKWFTISVCIHLCCVALVLVLALPLFLYFFNGGLAIPAARHDTCQVVYWCSVLVACGGVANVPFVAMFTAKQRIFELTLLQIVTAVATFSLSYALFFVDGDRLLVYALAMLLIHYAVYIIQGIRSFVAFPESRIVSFKTLSLREFGEMLSFSWWTFIDSFAFMLRGQVIQIVFNRFGTSGLNAAYSVANQLAGQTNVLSGALTSAMSPGIMSQYGAGDKFGAGRWSLRTCRIATFLALLVFIPLFVECKNIVNLWLVNPPEYTVCFVRVMAVMYLITQFVTGGNTLIKARGKIGLYEILVSVSYLSAIAVAVIVVLCRLPTYLAISGYLFSTIGYAFITILIACKCEGFDLRSWIVENLVPGLTILCTSLFAAIWTSLLFRGPIVKCLAVVLSSTLTIIPLSWIFLLKVDERRILAKKLLGILGAATRTMS